MHVSVRDEFLPLLLLTEPPLAVDYESEVAEGNGASE